MTALCGPDAAVIVKLAWPSERVICGLRVCKSLRTAIESEAMDILMQCRYCKHLSDRHQPPATVSQDVERLQYCILDLNVSFCGSLMNQIIGGLNLALQNGWQGTIRSIEFLKSDVALDLPALANVLSHCTTLHRLNLQFSSSPAGFLAVVNTLTGLSSLTFMGFHGIGLTTPILDQLGDSLVHLTALRVLDLGENLVTPSTAHFATISRLTQLKHFDFSSSYLQVSELAYAQLHLPASLVHLDLASHHIPMDWLRLSLDALTKLQFLVLRLCNLQDIGAMHVAQALERCPGLVTLDLAHNDIAGEGGMELGRELRHAPLLSSLDLTSNSLDPRAAARLFESLAGGHLSALSSLSLSNNPCFDGPSTRVLASALPCCPRLRSLQLRHTGLSSDAARALSSGLRHCTALAALDLARNDVDGSAGVEVAIAVRECTALQELDLSHNPLGCAGVSRIVRCLERGVLPGKQRCVLRLQGTHEDAASKFVPGPTAETGIVTARSPIILCL